MGNDVFEISNGVFFVGTKDSERKIFDALIPLPHGTSYNSYLVRGTEKTSLIDTVNQGFEKALENNISSVTDLKNLDFIIMNHAEPDHANAIPYLLKKCSKAKIISSVVGMKVLQNYYNVPADRIMPVKDGDTVDLGGKTLKFIYAPFLHWPETMFTYLVEEGILFPCDFFGAHTSEGRFEDDVKNIISVAKQYYGEIMMPFSVQGKNALAKIRPLGIKIIAPSHGPVYRNPEKIISEYEKWTSGKTEKKAIVVYVSMWQTTKGMAEKALEILKKEGIKTTIYNLLDFDLNNLVEDLVDSRAVVFCSPTVLNGLHPLGLYATHVVKLLKPPIKHGIFLSSYGWAPAAGKQFVEILAGTGIEFVGSIEINWKPNEEDNKKIEELARKLAAKIKE